MSKCPAYLALTRGVWPPQVAVEQHDLDFMATATLNQHVRRRWRGAEYMRLAGCNDVGRALALLNPLMGYRWGRIREWGERE